MGKLTLKIFETVDEYPGTDLVADMAKGRFQPSFGPATRLQVTLRRVQTNGLSEDIGEYEINNEGHADGALVEGKDFRAGKYELNFTRGVLTFDITEDDIGACPCICLHLFPNNGWMYQKIPTVWTH